MKPLYSIQVLRAFAALAVVLFHAFHAEGPAILGQAGVDVFFVVSGFIMWLTTRREPTPGDFLLHRVVRIAPLYWLATLAMAAKAHPAPWRLGLSLAFVPHLNAAGEVFPVLVQGWTLVYEMFFYVLFAAVLLLPRHRHLGALAALLTALVAARPFAPAGAIGDAFTNPLLLEFLFGLLLGRVWETGQLRGARLGGALLAGGLALLAATLAVTRAPGDWRALLWGAPAGFIVMGALMLEGAVDLSRLRRLAVLGDASYSLYLVHALVLGPVERLLSRLPHPLPELAASAASVVVALLVWRFVERPITGWLRRAVSRAADPAAGPRGVPASAPEAPPRSRVG